MSPNSYVVVITTCATLGEAERISSDLLTKRLCACVQTEQVTSTYRWNGKLESSDEWRLLIKAKQSDYPAIESLIASTHSYQNPEILALPVIAGSALYLNWIAEETI